MQSLFFLLLNKTMSWDFFCSLFAELFISFQLLFTYFEELAAFDTSSFSIYCPIAGLKFFQFIFFRDW